VRLLRSPARYLVNSRTNQIADWSTRWHHAYSVGLSASCPVNSSATCGQVTIAQKLYVRPWSKHEARAYSMRAPIDIVFTPFCREIQDEQIRSFRIFLRCSWPAVGRQEWSDPKPRARCTIYNMHMQIMRAIQCMHVCCLLAADELDVQMHPLRRHRWSPIRLSWLVWNIISSSLIWCKMCCTVTSPKLDLFI